MMDELNDFINDDANDEHDEVISQKMNTLFKKNTNNFMDSPDPNILDDIFKQNDQVDIDDEQDDQNIMEQEPEDDNMSYQDDFEYDDNDDIIGLP